MYTGRVREPRHRVTFEEPTIPPRKVSAGYWHTPAVQPSPFPVPFGFDARNPPPPPAPRPSFQTLPKSGKQHKPTDAQLKDDQAAMLPLIQTIVNSQGFAEGNTYNPMWDDAFFCVVRPPLTINPFLQTLSWDMRTDPLITPQWNQLATYPQVARINLCSPHMPWQIEVDLAGYSRGVLCGDLLQDIRETLRIHLFSMDLDGASEEHLAAMSDAYEDDANPDDEDPYQGMLRRIHWLRGRCQYAGLVVDSDFVKDRYGLDDPRMLVLHSEYPPAVSDNELNMDPIPDAISTIDIEA